MNTELRMKAPDTSLIDWTSLGTVWSILVAIVTIAFKWIKSNQESKKLEKEAFIRSVVTAAMESSLSDVNDKISSLFEYREKDRENLDRKFETIMKELKK